VLSIDLAIGKFPKKLKHLKKGNFPIVKKEKYAYFSMNYTLPLIFSLR